VAGYNHKVSGLVKIRFLHVGVLGELLVAVQSRILAPALVAAVETAF
jgi:hypothetical protein